MNLLSKVTIIYIGVIVFLALCSFSIQINIERLSVDFVVKTLKDGKSINMKGELYYAASTNKMITHFSSPIEQIVVTNSVGQFKSYDPKLNVVVQDENKDYSSQLSFVYSFMSSKTQDMGLQALGYQLKDSRVEGKRIITIWQPKTIMQGISSKVELVHENRQPIYMCFFNNKQKPEQKVFYSDYQKVGEIFFPMTITEFQYFHKGDSIITKRVYSDTKVNNEVSDDYFNFKIPDNAKVVSKQ